jgi:hypothetical protein
MSAPIHINGFTNDTLGWKAWLDVVQLAQATPAQMSVLEESHPKAKDFAPKVVGLQCHHVCAWRFIAG